MLDPLLETGELPHLQALREAGAHGVLESTIPFYTGPAWASFATAASPAAHGIYDFAMLREGGELTSARQSDLRRVTYFEQLAREGRRSVLVNLPLDQGARDGSVIVNSWLTVDDARRIYPDDRRERYAGKLDAYLNYPTTFRAPLRTHLDELCLIEERRFELARALFEGEEWDHFYLLFSAPDWLGHWATDASCTATRARRRSCRLYRQLDGYVGWFARAGAEPPRGRALRPRPVRGDVSLHVNGLLRDLGYVTLCGASAPRRSTAPSRWPLRGTPGPAGARPASPRAAPAAGRAPAQGDPRQARRRALTPLAGARRRPGPVACVHADDRVLRRSLRGLGTPDHRADPRGPPRRRLPDGRAALDGVWTFAELYGAGRARRPGFPLRPRGGRPAVDERDDAVRRAGGRAGGRPPARRHLLLAGPGVQAVDLGRRRSTSRPTLMWATGGGSRPTRTARPLRGLRRPARFDTRAARSRSDPRGPAAGRGCELS